jgi:ATP-dependent RNA helicase RhlE
MKFEDLKITRQFLNAIEDAGYSSPTDIQMKAIPPIRSGQDLIGIAQTGTGKTAAYVLPLLQTIKYAQGDAPRCLILCPTKELVMQVSQQVDVFGKYTDIRSLALYGGVGPKSQLEEIEKGCDVMVATPGRFLELYFKGGIVSKKIKYLVLDEADRMLDMGFMPKLRQIFEVIPNKRQNLLFSATFPERVEILADEFLLFPLRIEVTPPATPVTTVSQELYHVPNFMTKLNLLGWLLNERSVEFQRVIVFVRTKLLAENLSKYLARKDFGEVRVIHSNKGQHSRMNSMDDFKAGEVRILVSTDVSARGIDIPDVSHVINFSVPREHQDYVHRIGRTGRAFKHGIAITFADQSEQYHIGKIEKVIGQKIPVLELPDAIEIAKTTIEERQEQAMEVDRQKRKEDPNFKGAFHDKKKPQSRKKKFVSRSKRR